MKVLIFFRSEPIIVTNPNHHNRFTSNRQTDKCIHQQTFCTHKKKSKQAMQPIPTLHFYYTYT